MIRAADAEVTARSPAGDVVLAYIRTQVLAIARYDPLVRRDAPDAVHQMRVATRRARSALQAFGQIVLDLMASAADLARSTDYAVGPP